MNGGIILARFFSVVNLADLYCLCVLFLMQTTPVWRAGPHGPKTLCNACGVRYMKVAKRK